MAADGSSDKIGSANGHATGNSASLSAAQKRKARQKKSKAAKQVVRYSFVCVNYSREISCNDRYISLQT